MIDILEVLAVIFGLGYGSAALTSVIIQEVDKLDSLDMATIPWSVQLKYALTWPQELRRDIRSYGGGTTTQSFNRRQRYRDVRNECHQEIEEVLSHLRILNGIPGGKKTEEYKKLNERLIALRKVPKELASISDQAHLKYVLGQLRPSMNLLDEAAKVREKALLDSRRMTVKRIT